MIRAALLFIGLAAVSSAWAHQDRILPIKADGSMPDVPSEFGRAKLQVAFSRLGQDEPPVTSVVLELGSKQIELPVCVTGLLLSRDMGDVSASGSWYHDESRGLPYYINIQFFDHLDAEQVWTSPRFTLLFNLRTGKLMEMHVYIEREKGVSMQRIPVDLSERCPPDSLKTFWQPREHWNR